MVSLPITIPTQTTLHIYISATPNLFSKIRQMKILPSTANNLIKILKYDVQRCFWCKDMVTIREVTNFMIMLRFLSFAKIAKSHHMHDTFLTFINKIPWKRIRSRNRIYCTLLTSRVGFFSLINWNKIWNWY